jgi:hypothetical protein
MGYESIPGWFSSEAADVYRDMVATCPGGGTICEVGVAFGRSLAFLAGEVLKSGKYIRVVAVDNWYKTSYEPPHDHTDTPPNGDAVALEAMREGGGSQWSAFLYLMRQHAPRELDIVHVVRGQSWEAAKAFGFVHGVFLDAAHDYESVSRDIAAWAPHVGHGGILAGDDHAPDFPGVQQACSEAFGPSGYTVRGRTWRRRCEDGRGGGGEWADASRHAYPVDTPEGESDEVQCRDVGVGLHPQRGLRHGASTGSIR